MSSTTIEQLEAARDELAAQAVSVFQGDGVRPTGSPLTGAATAAGEWMPLILGFVLADALATAFGIDPGSVHAVRQLCLVAAAVGSIAAVGSLHGRARRPALEAIALVAAGAALVIAGVSGTLPVVATALAVAAGSTGVARVARHAFSADTRPPASRRLAAVADRGAALLGACAAASLGAWSPGGWRGASVVTGISLLGLAAAAACRRDPGYGTADARAVRELVNRRRGIEVDRDETLRLSPLEGVRHVLSAPSSRLAAIGVLAAGSTVAPALAFTIGMLREDHHLPAADRAAAIAVACGVAGVLVLAASRARRSADGAALPFAAVALVGIAFAPVSPVVVIALGAALAGLALAEGQLVAAALSGVEPMLRPHAAGVLTAAWFVGAAQALQFTGSIESRYGPGTALVVLGVSLAPIAGLTAAVRRRSAEREHVVAVDLVEDQQLRVLASTAADIPLLACRHVDFGYGGLQVLFDVSFTVAAGEMVALLGTNGAGKSTLLRAISGLGRPTAGSVRYDGHDITGFDPPRRVAAGIVQVPGGKARFPSMTVADNLRAAGHVLGRDRPLLEARIDDVFAAFPRLAERRNELAATLSGGEAQMLALGKALLLRPRLLLIDELSLGLAPKIVGDLLELVRTINAAGTAVVLVEQSVNIALSLVDHAYFMEKGRIRFDGPAHSLLGRGDLLRSVFLEGAGSVR